MKRKTRREKLVEQIRERLAYLEERMLNPSEDMTNADYERICSEAMKLRDALKML